MWFLINKPLHDLSNPNPWRLSLTVSGCQNFLSKIFLEPAPSSTSLEPAPSWSPPRSLCAIVPDHGWTPLCIGIFPDPSRWCHRPHRRHPEAHGAVPKPATPSSSPSPCYFQACDTIDPCHPWALNTVVFSEPVTLSSPWCTKAHNVIEPTSSLSPQYHHPPWAQNVILYIFLCHF
jgi:hypothetical protein